MGRNNQLRRAAKARARAKQQNRPREGAPSGGAAALGWPQAPQPSIRDQLAGWLERAFHALSWSYPDRADSACAEIVALAAEPAGRRVVTATLTDMLTSDVEGCWERGWQPADLHRVVGRRLDGDAQQVLADAVAAQLSRYARGTTAPRWLAQLHEIGATVWWSTDTNPVSARALTGEQGLDAVVPHAVRVAYLLSTLPAIERHDPLPGRFRPQHHRPSAPVDERILTRVRALLAKAESTTFEAEAETFTAGAQALMARHSIDAAMLAAHSGGAPGGGPHARRFWIDRPYEGPKVLLLDVVATANRCRSIWRKDFGFVTLVGFESDLEAAETIFTSLLVQANHGMRIRGRRTTHVGTSRTRAFRSSFLTAYAHRIGERLRGVTDEETDAAVGRATRAQDGSGQELVRVLGVRAEAVDDAVKEMFPRVVEHAVGSTSDVEGWYAGRRAADEATLFGSERAVSQ